MEIRQLGNSGLEIAPLIFGGNVFGWTVNQAMTINLLDAFVSAGFNCIDTADMYSRWKPGNRGGESETMIGHWLKLRRNRHKVIIATKVGKDMGPGQCGLSRAYIFRAVEASLRRLQTDYIDLYQAHTDDYETPLEETLSAFEELIQQGKVRAIGASNYSGERLAKALAISDQLQCHRFECLQPLYNLYSRYEYEMDHESLCLKEGLAVIPYFALASGFLTGKYRSSQDLTKSVRGQSMKEYMNERGFGILVALEQVARYYHSTSTSVALAWLMARPGITAPIASATQLNQLHDIMAAVELKLNHEAVELLNQASALQVTAAAGGV